MERMDEFDEYCIEDNDGQEEWICVSIFRGGGRGIGIGVKIESTRIGPQNRLIARITQKKDEGKGVSMR